MLGQIIFMPYCVCHVDERHTSYAIWETNTLSSRWSEGCIQRVLQAACSEILTVTHLAFVKTRLLDVVLHNEIKACPF